MVPQNFTTSCTVIGYFLILKYGVTFFSCGTNFQGKTLTYKCPASPSIFKVPTFIKLKRFSLEGCFHTLTIIYANSRHLVFAMCPLKVRQGFIFTFNNFSYKSEGLKKNC